MTVSNETTDDTEQYEEGDEVQITMRAFLIEEYPDGTALVDADGKEILVAEDEWQ